MYHEICCNILNSLTISAMVHFALFAALIRGLALIENKSRSSGTIDLFHLRLSMQK